MPPLYWCKGCGLGCWRDAVQNGLCRACTNTIDPQAPGWYAIETSWGAFGMGLVDEGLQFRLVHWVKTPFRRRGYYTHDQSYNRLPSPVIGDST